MFWQIYLVVILLAYICLSIIRTVEDATYLYVTNYGHDIKYDTTYNNTIKVPVSGQSAHVSQCILQYVQFVIQSSPTCCAFKSSEMIRPLTYSYCTTIDRINEFAHESIKDCLRDVLFLGYYQFYQRALLMCRFRFGI